MNIFQGIAACGSFVACSGLGMQLVNVRDFALLNASEAPGDCRIAACVAMRNEERAAAACIASLLRQPDVCAVIVADDGSTDATVDIVRQIATRDSRVVLVQCDPALANGKASALVRAAAAADSAEPTHLYFTDADVRHDDGAVAALLLHLRSENVDAVSAWPRTDPAGFWDGVFAITLITFLLQALPMRIARSGTGNAAAANGQSFLVKLDAYRRCGGHARIHGNVEDVELAKLLRRTGGRIALASAAGLARVRGYGSFRDNARGYGRSLYFGAGAFGSVLFACWQLIAFVVPWALLPIATRYALPGTVASFTAVAISSMIMRKRWWLAFVTPLCGAAAAFAATLALAYGRKNAFTWRGRTLQ